MRPRWLRAVASLALAPAAAFAFETVDRLPFPSAGAFPAWPPEGARPWHIWAYGGVMHDTNALRRSTTEESDTVARVGAGGRATGRIVGRQRYLVEGFGEYYDFDRFSQIDHFGYWALGHYLFEVGNDVNGAAGYERRRRHAELGEFRSEERAMVTSERVFVDGGYRFHPDWRIFGLVEHNSAERGGAESADAETNRVRATLTYSTPLGNAFGLEVRRTRGEGGFFDPTIGVRFADDYDETDVGVLVVYALGAQLRVRARVGRTEREYDELRERDFSGTSYRGGIEWLPTTKLRFALDVVRAPESTLDADASHVFRRGETFSIAYAATYKLVFTARFANERRQYQGTADTLVSGLPVPDDTVRTWSFGAGWEPLRHWQLGAGVEFGERSSNILGRDYDYTQYMLNARWEF